MAPSPKPATRTSTRRSHGWRGTSRWIRRARRCLRRHRPRPHRPGALGAAVHSEPSRSDLRTRRELRGQQRRCPTRPALGS